MERPMTPNAKPFPNSLAGRLLLAMPGMPDPRFQHSVLAMCVHDADGALGIGIGEELGLTLHALLDDLDIPRGVAPDVPVLSGGPVERHRGFVLHSPDWPRADSANREGTLAVGPHWSLTGSRDVLRRRAVRYPYPGPLGRDMARGRHRPSVAGQYHRTCLTC